MSPLKIDHVTLMVSSFEQSMPYYEHLLPLVGFTRKRNHVWTDGDGFFFQFLQAKPGTAPYGRYGAGMNHLGFGASAPEQVYAIRQSMQDAEAKRCQVWTDTWLKRNGQWQIVAAQDTVIPCDT
jgi:catechol 2,3-dioxygenase-like lactoylglutathione lyase family enzyme